MLVFYYPQFARVNIANINQSNTAAAANVAFGSAGANQTIVQLQSDSANVGYDGACMARALLPR